MPTFDFPETFVIHTRTLTGQDDDGNDIYADVDVTTSGAFAPEGSTELIQGEDVTITNPTLYLTDGAPTPAATDQVTVRGERFEVDGVPQVLHNPFTGYQPGAVVRLERVT